MATAQEMIALRQQQKQQQEQDSKEKLNITVDDNKQIIVTKQ